MKGFDPKWCEWVKCFVEGGNVGIKVNDQVGSYFQTKKGLRPSTVEGANEGANTLFDTVDVLFGTIDREGVGNEEGANLLSLPPLWSA